MSVELSQVYKDAFERNNNFKGAEEFRNLSETIINLAKDLGDYDGKWFRVEFRDHIYSTTLNIYHGADPVFQASENMYGDWTVIYNEIPNHFEVAMAIKQAGSGW